jgi:hypothetical protein
VKPSWRPKARSSLGAQSGQAAVETALILPLFIFLILGTLQLGLMHQARLVTKYAAYKAVREGSLHHGRKGVMERAALAALLPLISEGRGGGEYIQPLTRAEDFQQKWSGRSLKNNAMRDAPFPYVEATICGPLRKEAPGGMRELDFDDPGIASHPEWRPSQRTKLRVQLTLYYRMPIPFANWVIHNIVLRKELPWVLRMGRRTPQQQQLEQRYAQAASQGIYILPIRAAYTTRMQSNLYLSELPEANTCWTTNRGD